MLFKLKLTERGTSGLCFKLWCKAAETWVRESPVPYIPLATICTFLAGGALLWPTVLQVRF